MKVQRVLYRTREQAIAAIKSQNKSILRDFHKSVCDCERLDEIKDAELAKAGVQGMTNCYRSLDGSIYAWWED